MPFTSKSTWVVTDSTQILHHMILLKICAVHKVLRSGSFFGEQLCFLNVSSKYLFKSGNERQRPERCILEVSMNREHG